MLYQQEESRIERKIPTTLRKIFDQRNDDLGHSTAGRRCVGTFECRCFDKHSNRVKHQRHALEMGLARSSVVRVVLVISELSNVRVILVKERVPRRPRCIYMRKDDRREKELAR